MHKSFKIIILVVLFSILLSSSISFAKKNDNATSTNPIASSTPKTKGIKLSKEQSFDIIKQRTTKSVDNIIEQLTKRQTRVNNNPKNNKISLKSNAVSNKQDFTAEITSLNDIKTKISSAKDQRELIPLLKEIRDITKPKKLAKVK